MAPFRVALSGDFLLTDGTPAYPMFDLSPLATTPDLEFAYVDALDGVMQAADLAGFDALILLAPRSSPGSAWATITSTWKLVLPRVSLW
jgi:hypothetical protein